MPIWVIILMKTRLIRENNIKQNEIKIEMLNRAAFRSGKDAPKKYKA